MLVLTRKESESLIIYPDNLEPGITVSELFNAGRIIITVEKVKNGSVRIGLDLPAEINVVRDEIMG